ncbi:MAG: IMP dehydrogenase [Defluviitaleaceae bacterium]|nr:IMP dehydrogenase [Defluviitaleaceae bacterium]MCL2262007.1 IMP dehydrogenase [Defluviitaleaceae bacterium]
MEKILGNGLTFDDVLIVPEFSDISPAHVDTTVKLAKGIELKIPFLSAGMDTVTESQMAIAIARCGGLGIIHRHMPIAAQASEVDRVKRSEHGVITDPFFLSPNHYVYEADKLMGKYRISGVPIIEHDKLVGIITNRDLRFETDYSKKIYEVMTRENLITAPAGTTLEEAKVILTRHKVEKLPLVDDNGNLKGLITIKDINKSVKYPLSAKDAQGRLIAGAAVGIKDDYMERVHALAKRKVDVLALEVFHGHAKDVLAAVRAIKGDFPEIALIAGNVATPSATKLLIDAGADVIKVGIGPSSVSTKRMISGVGVPQISAIISCAEVAREKGIPIVADGGIRFSGDIAKAIAAGASACMMGNLFSGCEESPGTTELFQGRKYKIYRGMESSPYDETELNNLDSDNDNPRSAGSLISRGVEGRITYKGNLSDVLHQLIGGLVVGMSYAGCRTLTEMQENARFVQVTQAGLRESHPHDILITRESPNYNMA